MAKLCPECLGRRFVYSPGGYGPKLECPTCTGAGEFSSEAPPISSAEGRAGILPSDEQKDRAEAERFRGALAKIAEGLVPPDQHGHYLAHREAVKIARAALRMTPSPHQPGGVKR